MMMRKVLSRLALAAMVLAAWIPKPAGATQFGMDYFPYIAGCDTNQFLINRYWTPANKAMVAADLNQMNSMGLTCQRLMMFSNGWVISPYPGPNYFSSDFDEICANLPEYLGMCAARNIKLVVCLDSGWLDGTQAPGVYWWQYCYGSDTAGWSAYMADVQTFITRIVNAVETSPYASTVLWYDIHNEIYTQRPNNAYQILYLRAIYDGGWIPASKIGFSVLSVPPTGTTDYNTLKTSTWLGATRAANTRLTDSHAYPEATANDWNVGFKYQKARSTFPNSTTICGEYAYSFTGSGGEAAQATSEITLMDNAIAAGIPYAMHWELIDLYNHPEQYGWCRNRDINQPNDVMGKVVDKLSLFSNGDFESGDSQNPTGWSGGSNNGHPLTFSRINGQDCTGNYFYRIAATTVPDNIYSLSPHTAVPKCDNIYVNAYIRGGNAGNIRIAIHQYDGNGVLLGTALGPTFNADGTYAWVSYQQKVGGWVCPANPETRYVDMGVVADILSAPGWLDTDCVSLSVRRSPTGSSGVAGSWQCYP